ncbi:cholinesterase 1-like [Penaeus monodon]|uniref:cholinesterase 1-like n=1 Tax=Penaeus monodon TaxID=6687 RepID=UPI0018A75461|nr:cholinesterase 1-like [Penaeus monodon]
MFAEKMRSTLLALCLAVAAAVAQEETVQVQLQQGVIEGARSEAGEGRFIYSFQTIPFAEPPVGDLRFKNPVPAAPWSGVRNGSLLTPMCIQQHAILGTKPEGQEDCLYLSVYTPRPYESDLPVMVWIHGGGFTIGGGGVYTPLPLLTKDVVLVTIQYRLSTLGFLSTGDSEIPGNLGLKDQTMALRWVQGNIRAFGGDPAKVTIFGESAGGASVHFHVLSPMSAGLFQRAIMQSGTAVCPWALREDHSEVAARFGEMFNCSGSSPLTSSELVACLREVPAEDLIKAPKKFLVISEFPSVMTPSVDGEFLPDHPATLLREGRYNKVDVMTGVTKHEGQSLVPFLSGNESSASLLKNLTTNGPVVSYLENEENSDYLARRSLHHYFGPLEDLAEKKVIMQEFYSDRLFRICNQDALEQHARDAAFGRRAFAYELQHVGEHGFLMALMGLGDAVNEHVSHGDDLQYLFDFGAMNLTLHREEDLFVRRIMVDLWTNFAATGDPTPDMSLGFTWEPATESGDSYLAITSSPSMKTFDNEEIRHFWRNMPLKTNQLLDPGRFSSRCDRPAVAKAPSDSLGTL